MHCDTEVKRCRNTVRRAQESWRIALSAWRCLALPVRAPGRHREPESTLAPSFIARYRHLTQTLKGDHANQHGGSSSFHLSNLQVSECREGREAVLSAIGDFHYVGSGIDPFGKGRGLCKWRIWPICEFGRTSDSSGSDESPGSGEANDTGSTARGRCLH